MLLIYTVSGSAVDSYQSAPLSVDGLIPGCLGMHVCHKTIFFRWSCYDPALQRLTHSLPTFLCGSGEGWRCNRKVMRFHKGALSEEFCNWTSKIWWTESINFDIESNLRFPSLLYDSDNCFCRFSMPIMNILTPFSLFLWKINETIITLALVTYCFQDIISCLYGHGSNDEICQQISSYCFPIILQLIRESNHKIFPILIIFLTSELLRKATFA